MPRHELQQQLDRLREQLDNADSLSSVEQEQVEELIEQIQLLLKLDAASPEASLFDSLEQTVENFELERPTLAVTLRNIIQTLANMGI